MEAAGTISDTALEAMVERMATRTAADDVIDASNRSWGERLEGPALCLCEATGGDRQWQGSICPV